MKKDEFTKSVERLREVNEVVKDLEPALQSEAVKILTRSDWPRSVRAASARSEGWW